MHVNIVDHGTSRTQRIGGGGIRTCTHASLRAGGGDLAGGVHSGTGGGVHLVRVVNLNDLYRFEVACRFRRELGGEDRTNREVRGDEHTHLGVLYQQLSQGVQVFGGPTGRTNHSVHTVLHREAHIRLAGFRNGQVNNNLCAGIDQLLQVVATAQSSHQVHVCGGVDGAHRLRAHAACGTEYRYLPDFFVALVGHDSLLRSFCAPRLWGFCGIQPLLSPVWARCTPSHTLGEMPPRNLNGIKSAII